MNHISTLRLHQFRLGELAPDAAQRVQTHLTACEVCADRLGVQRARRLAFQREAVPVALQARPSWLSSLRRRWYALALVPALGAAFFALAPATPPGAPVVRSKGPSPTLEAWVQTGESARPLYTGERVHEGMRIQLKFNPGDHRFVTLAGRDGSGAIEVYGTLPSAGPGLATAPFALTLDGTRGEQAFFAVLTDVRPDPLVLTRSLGRSPVAVPTGEVATVILPKE